MIKLCAVDELADPGSKGFQNDDMSVFVIKQGSQIYVYENSCPHLGINLEWQEDQFLDSEQRLIQCSTHGALFLIHNGECIAGPCPGEKLTRMPHKIQDGAVYLLQQSARNDND